MQRLSVLKTAIALCGVAALLAVLASLYVNFGLYRPEFTLAPEHVKAADRPGVYQYSLAQISQRETSYAQLLPGGGAMLYGRGGRAFAKRQSCEDVAGMPGDGFYVTRDMLFFAVADGSDPRTGAAVYRFERPVRPRWALTAFALFILMASIAAYRFAAGRCALWDAVYAFIFITLFSVLLWSTFRAPGGMFLNVYGGTVGMWYDNDPGSWYIATAHELGRKPPVYPGHPGIPMVLGLAGIQKAVASFAPDAFTYSEAVAANIFYVQVLSRLMCMLVFVAAALVLRKIVVLMFGSRFAGALASLLFFTSFFSLYYMNRVSPEGCALLFFLLTFLFLLHAHRNNGRPVRLGAYAFAACFASVCAFYAKLHLMAGFPFFVACLLVAGFIRTLRSRDYAVLLLASCAGFFSAWLWLDRYMDWSAFNTVWRIGSESSTAMPVWSLYYHKAVAICGKLFTFMGQLSLQDLLPMTDQSRTFSAFGSGLALLFVASFLWKPVRSNRFFLALCLYVAFTVAIFFYRGFSMVDFDIEITKSFGGFHYLLPFFAAASIAAAFVIDRIVRKNDDGTPAGRGLPAFLLVCLLNVNGFLAVMDMHLHRVRSNAAALPLYGMLSRLEPHETIPGPVDITGMLGMAISISSYNLGEPSKLEYALGHMSSQQISPSYDK